MNHLILFEEYKVNVNYNPFERKIPVLRKFNKSGLTLVDPDSNKECKTDIPEEKWIEVYRVARHPDEDDKLICKVFLHDDSDCYLKYGKNMEERKDFIWKEYEGWTEAPHCIWDAYFWIIKNLI